MQNELLPLTLCRHVLKFILDRPINWYDLAFFDAHLFESLRKMVQEADENVDFGLHFILDLSPEEVMMVYCKTDVQGRIFVIFNLNFQGRWQH